MRNAVQSKACGIRIARLAATLLLLLSPLTVRAAVQFDVFLGYDGVGREACWLPIVCEIKNDGPPINGFVEVSPASYSRGQAQQIPVELPTGTLKRVTIPVFAISRHSPMWNVRLANERGKTVAEQTAQRPRRQVGWEIPLMGSLARTASGAPSIRSIARDQQDVQPLAARFQASIFPDNPLVLEGLDAIYLSSEVAVALRSSQANALIGWMNAGGHLIVGIEQVSDVTSLSWLNSLMPVEPKDMKTIGGHAELHAWLRSPLAYASRAPAMGNMPVYNYGPRPTRSTRGAIVESVSAEAPFASLPDDATFELADMQIVTGSVRDGEVVIKSGDAPLVVTANRGLGRITALMFSPEREPFKSWKHGPTFWARLLEVPAYLYTSSDYYPAYGQSPDGIFGALIDSRQIHKLPIGWLLLLLVVYLVVIGPLDQWWLKRIGKPMLTWITFPCYVVLFSVMIYFIGYKLRSGESEYNELHIVDVLRNADRAELRGRTYASIYSPNNAKFTLESKQKYATIRSEFLGVGSETGERAAVTQKGDSFKAEVFVPVWTSQLFVSDWWQGAASPFDVTITPQTGGWRVTVKNNTERAVKAAQLVIADRMIPLGEVGAGATATFTAKTDGAPSVAQFVQQHAAQFQRATQQRQSAFGASTGGRLSDPANSTMAASFLSEHHPQNQNYMSSFIQIPGLDLAQAVERGGAVLLAWAPDEAPVPGLNQFRARRASKNTLWRVPVQLQ